MGKGGRGRLPSRNEAVRDRLELSRGYLQQELILLWNTCQRCNHRAIYHPSGGYGVCGEFVAAPLHIYRVKAEGWERLHKENPIEIEPYGVILYKLERKTLSDDDKTVLAMYYLDKYETETIPSKNDG